ncbi:MAG: nitrilase-related carbon-nitrogen hydrolase [Bacteroidota bacterium]
MKAFGKILGLLLFVASLALAFYWGKSAADSENEDVQEAMESDTQETILVRGDGSYPTVPLEKDTVVLKVVQTRVKSLQKFPTIEEGLEENMAYMEKMGRQAASEGAKPDILLYHEFPLTGYSSGSRSEKLKFTIQVPGPETERLGKLAKELDSYIIFGSYVSDPDWPDHILSINTVINRKGEVVKKFWKSRNIKRIFEGIELTTTTVEGVRDAYREKYGMDEEFPVLQTEFGNIAVSTVQWDPFIFAAFAMKGTEIMLRTATLFVDTDVMATANQNKFYSAMANFTLPEESGYNAGESLIVGPDGKVLAKHPSKSEDGIIEAKIPIAAFRANRKIPSYSLDIVRPIFDQYQQEVPMNHLDLAKDELPQTGKEMKVMIDSISRYLN